MALAQFGTRGTGVDDAKHERRVETIPHDPEQARNLFWYWLMDGSQALTQELPGAKPQIPTSPLAKTPDARRLVTRKLGSATASSIDTRLKKLQCAPLLAKKWADTFFPDTDGERGVVLAAVSRGKRDRTGATIGRIGRGSACGVLDSKNASSCRRCISSARRGGERVDTPCTKSISKTLDEAVGEESMTESMLTRRRCGAHGLR